MIHVIIADDHPVVRTGLRALVESEPDMQVVASVDSAEALLAHLASPDAVARVGADPTVVLCDLRFGSGLTGADATARIVASGGPPVLILTTFDTDGDIVRALEAGAKGYLLKDAPTGDLLAAIRATASGQVTLDPVVQRRLVGRLRRPATALTPREIDVLHHIADGASNDEIASRLAVTRATVKTHIVHIFDKLQVSSRTEAVKVARSQGVID